MTLSLTTIQLALRAPLAALAGLPATKLWEQSGTPPTAGTPYITDSLAPSTSSLWGFATFGFQHATGLYIVRWHAVQGQHLALARSADAVLAAYPVGLQLTASDGTVVRIGAPTSAGEVIGPSRSQIIDTDDGRAVTTITIPYTCTIATQ